MLCGNIDMTHNRADMDNFCGLRELQMAARTVSDGGGRVLRGGSWYNIASRARAARRHWYGAAIRLPYRVQSSPLQRKSSGIRRVWCQLYGGYVVATQFLNVGLPTGVAWADKSDDFRVWPFLTVCRVNDRSREWACG